MPLHSPESFFVPRYVKQSLQVKIFQRHAEFQILSFMSPSSAVSNRDTAGVVRACLPQPSCLSTASRCSSVGSKSKVIAEKSQLGCLLGAKQSRTAKTSSPQPFLTSRREGMARSDGGRNQSSGDFSPWGGDNRVKISLVHIYTLGSTKRCKSVYSGHASVR